MKSVETCFINLKLCCISIFFHISCCLLLTFFKSDHHFVPSNPFVSSEKPAHTLLSIFQMSLEEDVSIFAYFVLFWKAKAVAFQHTAILAKPSSGGPSLMSFCLVTFFFPHFHIKGVDQNIKKIRNNFYKSHLKFM